VIPGAVDGGQRGQFDVKNPGHRIGPRFQADSCVIKIADGAAPSALPYETLSDYAKLVNLQAADKLKLNLSEATLKNYKVLVEKNGTSHFGK